MKETLMFTSNQVFGMLRPLGTPRRIAPGTVLFRQGEAPKEVVLVLNGDVALTPAATEPTLCRLAGSGAVLGLPASLSGKAYGLTAVAGDSCEVVSVARKQFLAAIQQDSELALGVVQMLAQELSEVQNIGLRFRLAQLEESGSSGAEERMGAEKWPM